MQWPTLLRVVSALFRGIRVLAFGLAAAALIGEESIALADSLPPPPEFGPPWGKSDARGHWNRPYGTEWDDNRYGNSRWSYDGMVGVPTKLEGEDCWGGTGSSSQTLKAFLFLVIDNSYAANATKQLWVQYDYYVGGATLADPIAEGDIDGSWATDDVNETFATRNGERDLGNNWRRASFVFTLTPQPARERVKWDFTIGAGGDWGIKNIYYGTKCSAPSDVPGPSAVTGIMGMALVTVILRLTRR